MNQSFLVAYSVLQIMQPAPAVPPELLEPGILSVTIEEQTTLTAVPRGSSRVPMLTLLLKADCSADVSVNELSVRRMGLGAAADIAGVYVLSHDLRYSDSRPVSRRGEATLRLRRFVVPACESRRLVVHADFVDEAEVAGQHRLELVTNSIVTNAASVRLTSQKPAVVRPLSARTRRSTVAVRMLTPPRSLRVGERRSLGSFSISASDTAEEVTRITITNQGTARDEDIRNIRLLAGREVISNTVAELRNDQAVFTIDPPLVIRRGRERTVSIEGDIAGGSSRTLRFDIEQPSDIVVAPRSGRR